MSEDYESKPRPAGLTTSEVTSARERFGWNELPQAKTLSPLAVFFRQFQSLLVVILIAAALIAQALGETIDAIVIALVLVLNAILGFVQEWRAETALEALRSMLSPTAVVVRDGAETAIPAREIVPGDLVVLAAGEIIPADLEIVDGSEIRADESVMTGESLSVEKSPDGRTLPDSSSPALCWSAETPKAAQPQLEARQLSAALHH